MDADDMDIEDIDDELNLPGDLVNLNIQAKRELLEYKRSHNERDWEEEMLRRIESLGKSKDYLMLKRLQDKAGAMGGGDHTAAASGIVGGKRGRTTVAAAEGSRKRGRAAASKGVAAAESDDDDDEDDFGAVGRRRQNRKASSSAAASKLLDLEGSDEEEEDEDLEEGSDDDALVADDDDDDDDLFNSDEEEAATNAVLRTSALTNLRKASAVVAATKAAAAAAKKQKQPVKTKATRKSKFVDSSDEDSDDYDDDDDDDLLPKAKRSGKGKAAGRRAQDDSSDKDDSADDDSDDSGAAGRRRGRYGSDERRRESGLGSRATDEPDTSGPAELEDYHRIQVRRVFVEKWVAEPFFETVMRRQFARVYVGQNQANNTPIYRMCEVHGVVPYRRTYKLSAGDPAHGVPPVMTDQAVSVSIGSSRITMKMDSISNSRISEAELARYLQDLAKQMPPHVPITKNEAKRRRDSVTKALNHVYTHDEIQALVKKRMGLSDFLTTEFSTAKERLQDKLSAAIEKGDTETQARIERELIKLEGGYEQQKEKFLKQSATKFTSLNVRNKEANHKSDIQASQKREEKEREIEASGDGGGAESKLDPFRRRETLPSIIWNTTGKLSEKSKEAADKDKAKAAKDKEAPKQKTAEEVAAARKQAEANYFALTRTISDGITTNGCSTTGTPAATSTSRAMAAASQGGAGHFRQKQFELTAGATTKFNFFEDLNLERIRNRVQGRLGLHADPLEFCEDSGTSRERYLVARCGHLPPVDTPERELLRRGLKLSGVIHANREEGQAEN